MSAAIEIIQEKVSDYELFTRFNNYYIQSRIGLIESDIEDMYDRTTPSLCSDTVSESIYYESYSAENLVIAILEERQKLERYKSRSQRELNAFYTVLGRSLLKEQKYIKNYINTRSEVHMNVIERFKIELYKYIQTNRNERNKGIENNYSYINDKRQKVKTYPHKLTLNQEKALREKEDGAAEKNMNKDEFVAKLNDLIRNHLKNLFITEMKIISTLRKY